MSHEIGKAGFPAALFYRTQKHALGQALIGSADSEANSPLVTDAQRAELRARLAHDRANPDEPGVTFSQLKGKFSSKVL